MNRSKRTARRRGFTLLEIIIAIAVLALLGSLSLVAVTSAMKYMKKVRRAARVDQVVKALEIYKQRYGEYPPSWPEFPAEWEEDPPAAWEDDPPIEWEFDYLPEQGFYAELLKGRYAAVRRHILKRWPKEVNSMPGDWIAMASVFDTYTEEAVNPFDGAKVLEYWLCTAEEEHGNAPILERDFLNKHRGEFAYFRARPFKRQSKGKVYVEGEEVAGRSPVPRDEDHWYADDSYQLFAPGEDGELGTGDDLANFTGGMTVDEFIAENE